MAITPKPFSAGAKILKRLFAGNPSIFSDVDVNQLMEIDAAAFTYLSQATGGLATGFIPTLTNVSCTEVVGSGSLDGILAAEIAFGGGGTLYYNKIAYTVPAFDFKFTTGNIGTLDTGNLLASGTVNNVVINVWLVATKTQVTYGGTPTPYADAAVVATDTGIAGITGPGFSGPLPSSDAIQYGSERVAYTVGKDVAYTALGTGEEVVCMICQVAFQPDKTGVASCSPYLLMTAPDTTLVNFPVQNAYSSNSVGLVGNLMKAFQYLSTLFNGPANTFWFSSSSGASPGWTNFSTQVQAVVTSAYYGIAALWSTGINTTNSGNWNSPSSSIVSQSAGNIIFAAVAATNTVGGIILKNGITTITPSDGTIITLLLSVSGGSGTVHLSFYPTDSSSTFLIGSTGVSAIGVTGTDTLVVTMFYKAGYWYVISTTSQPAIDGLSSFAATIYSDLTAEGVTRAAADTALQGEIDTINTELGAWEGSDTTAANFTSSGTITGTPVVNVKWHVIGKTLLCNYSFTFVWGGGSPAFAYLNSAGPNMANALAEPIMFWDTAGNISGAQLGTIAFIENNALNFVVELLTTSSITVGHTYTISGDFVMQIP